MAASDTKEVSQTCSWAGTHRPAATRGRSQTPTGTAHTGGAHTKGQTRHPHGKGTRAPAQTRPRQTPTGGPPPPGPPTRCTPTQRPDTDQATSITWEATSHLTVHLRSLEPALCRPPASVCIVYACVSMCVKRDHLRGPSPAPHPASPPPSPGSQPRTQAYFLEVPSVRP